MWNFWKLRAQNWEDNQEILSWTLLYTGIWKDQEQNLEEFKVLDRKQDKWTEDIKLWDQT